MESSKKKAHNGAMFLTKLKKKLKKKGVIGREAQWKRRNGMKIKKFIKKPIVKNKVPKFILAHI